MEWDVVLVLILLAAEAAATSLAGTEDECNANAGDGWPPTIVGGGDDDDADAVVLPSSWGRILFSEKATASTPRGRPWEGDGTGWGLGAHFLTAERGGGHFPRGNRGWMQRKFGGWLAPYYRRGRGRRRC
jgi:hypothetical protein